MQKHLQTPFITILVFFFFTQFSFAQNTLYQTYFNTIPDGITATGWQISPETLAGSYLISEIPNKQTDYDIILSDKISTIGYKNVTVFWNGRISLGLDAMTLYYSIGEIKNGIEKYYKVTLTTEATQIWSLQSVTLPDVANNVANLKLHWSYASSSKKGEFSTYSIDDLKITADIDPAGNNTLPVTLIYFTGKAENNKTVLKWQTATEKDNDRFEIQKSPDGKNFNFIGEVKANAGSNTIRNYSFTDLTSSGEVFYYRLKQIDLDGGATYSSTITVQNRISQQVQLSVFPNPVADFMQIQLPKEIAAILSVEILDNKGTAIKNVSSSSYININVKDLIPGIYIIKAVGKDNCYKAKFVKL